ncbi:MAG: hypothetical protein JNK72_21650 [Myxococcales bacterium]|nr:hypothetical protein [Myxococcales bacterium]
MKQGCPTMTLPYAPEAISAAAERACLEHHLESAFVGSVMAYMSEDEDTWPSCCGSGCEPCVLSLESAARRALILLEKGQV